VIPPVDQPSKSPEPPFYLHWPSHAPSTRTNPSLNSGGPIGPGGQVPPPNPNPGAPPNPNPGAPPVPPGVPANPIKSSASTTPICFAILGLVVVIIN
jgi:hypothetical protein